MKITKLEKKKRLYLLELDDTERLYITEDTIVRFMLTKGKDITDVELEDIRQFTQFSYGKNLALYHLSFKQRTSKEVRDYLMKHEIDEDIISTVIDSLTADKWLDDARYAQQLIQGNLYSGDKGPFALKQKLIQKGVPLRVIEAALEESDFTEVVERLVNKAIRKYSGKLPQKELKDKLTQHLLNKGFSYQTASSAIASATIDTDEEREGELLLAELEKQERKYSRKYDGYELKQRVKQALARKGYSFSAIDRAFRDYF
ncbi:recombination regulator RecX [Streptococcus sp. E24BD]|uniref:recombination regulator RecX n=1 Tax=Streptococcus sp. E24BD TaxID=3278715 RepID=UPI00359ECB73